MSEWKNQNQQVAARITMLGIMIAIYVVAFNVEVREVDGDPPLRWGQDLPYAVLVGRVQVWEGGRRDCPVRRVDQATTSI